MLIAIDKRGSINLPSELRKKLHLETGTYLDLSVAEGGAIVLSPVAVYPTVRLNEEGLKKLRDARESGTAEMPDWLVKEIGCAGTDAE